MSEPEPVDKIESEEAELLINDPDDYHEAQRLREIHDARREVHKVLRDIERYAAYEDHCRQRMDLADAVTAYIAELEPLMDATGWEDSVEKTDWPSLRGFATMMGRLPEPVEAPHPGHDEYHVASYESSMFIFRQANRFFDEIKPLVEEEETTEWEV
jgi:hypothetical protein